VSPGVEAAVADAFRDEWGRVLATLIRMTGDWDLAEECAQDAFALALERWPRDGVPRRPGAWLTTTARNRAVDRLRRGATESAKVQELLLPSQTDDLDDPDDDAWVTSLSSSARNARMSSSASPDHRHRPPMTRDRMRVVWI